MANKSCGICCEAYTKLFRKPVECAKCHYEACMKCYQTYLTSNPNTQCMSCQTPWTQDIIDVTFPKVWVSGPYSRFREGVLLDIEKAQLPTSQHLARNYKTVQELTERLQKEREEKLRIRKRLREIDISKWNIGNRIRRIKMSRYQQDGVGGEGDSSERRAFVRACPVDGCRGFLSSALKCGTCARYACGECFGVIGFERHTEHTCDPNDVETAKYIRKESRPCPTCAINISKIDGCDQMFCVQCRTAFSWRTGVIMTGTIHNPHYFEMLRNASATGEIPRQPGDDDGGCPQDITDPGRLTVRLYDRLSASGYKNGDVYTSVMKSQRHICHLFRDTMPRLRHHPTDNADLRMHYLLGTFDEAVFKRKLVLREKSMEKHAALLSCYGARIQMTIDVFQAYLEHDIDEKEVLLRLKAIHDMMIGFLHGIIDRFNSCCVEYGYCPKLM